MANLLQISYVPVLHSFRFPNLVCRYHGFVFSFWTWATLGILCILSQVLFGYHAMKIPSTWPGLIHNVIREHRQISSPSLFAFHRDLSLHDFLVRLPPILFPCNWSATLDPTPPHSAYRDLNRPSWQVRGLLASPPTLPIAFSQCGLVYINKTWCPLHQTCPALSNMSCWSFPFQAPFQTILPFRSWARLPEWDHI